MAETTKRLSFLDRYLIHWILFKMGIGIGFHPGKTAGLTGLPTRRPLIGGPGSLDERHFNVVREGVESP